MRYIKVDNEEINSGITYDADLNAFNIEFTKEKEEELISLTDIALHKSTIFNNVYLYGYNFKENASHEVRREFIAQIKALSQTKINSVYFKEFITRPIVSLGKTLYNITTALYPSSKRTQINIELIKYIRKFALVDSHDYITL